MGNDPPTGDRSAPEFADESRPDPIEWRETADGSATLFSSRYAQTYHSHHGAVTEARHVFLEGSRIGSRLRNGEAGRVLEVGFGTGLNFLLTAQQALEAGTPLSYVALERELLPAAVLDSLDYRQFASGPLAALLEFRQRLPERPQPGSYRTEFTGTGLELLIGEAVEAKIERNSFDAVYHDAFSPDSNCELWSSEFLARLAASLVPGGVLVSYTVKGEVRRRLVAAGLSVSKVPGPPGGKREMLRAVRSAP